MKFSAFALLCALFFSAGITSCKKSGGVNVTADTTLAQLNITNVFYGSDPAQDIDVYLPANRDTANTKAILFIHGGSWNAGDKNDFSEAITAIRDQLPGYAIFNMNYRLANNGFNRFPAQTDDIHSALTFIESKANEYKVNTNKICLIGASAGAHLALLYAYKNNTDNKIKAVVDLFGPSDLTDLYNHHPFPESVKPVLVNFLGTTPTANPMAYQQASPINFVTPSTVPTKIFHGTDDFVVPLQQSTNLKAKLQENNVKVEMTTYDGEGHGWLGNNLLDTYAKTIQFIKENVF